jgi:hypothetical protein
MAQKTNDAALRAIIDRFTRELTQAVAQQVQEQVAQAISQFRGPSSSKSDGRRAGRLCPVPNCGQPGAGPRNRWFCKNHASKLSATEQKSILERNRRLAADGKLPTQVPAQRIVRLPPKAQRARRALDMSCRVEGCPNRSRGPRAGFICDQHRNELSPDEQRQARDRWNARVKGGKVSAAPEPKTISPVPPIVRKAEPAEA